MLVSQIMDINDETIICTMPSRPVSYTHLDVYKRQLFIILKVYVGKIGTKLIDAFTTIYALMGKVINESSQGLTINMASSIVRQAIIIILNIIIPVLIVAVIIAILGNMLQQRWMVTAKPLAPKASKINPLNGFKRIFSVRQLFELIKAIAMMSIIGIMAVSYTHLRWHPIWGLQLLTDFLEVQVMLWIKREIFQKLNLQFWNVSLQCVLISCRNHGKML